MDLLPYSNSLCALQYTLLLTGLVVKSSSYRRTLWTPIALINVYLVLYTTTGDANGDTCLAYFTVTNLFTASDFMLLTDTHRELRLARQVTPTHQLPLASRIKWALHLMVSSRGVGWAHEPTAVLRPHPTASRWTFVRKQLLWACFYFLAFDLAHICNRQNPSFATGGPSLAAFGWMWRSINALEYAATTAAHISCLFCLVSALFVGLGMSNAENWPHLLGYWGDAYTLRRFWGRTWHQIMRRFVSAHGKFLANKVLRLRPGTNGSSYAQLYTAFFISGIIHYAGDYAMLRNWSGGSMRFFLLQAVAITFEDGVIALAKRIGLAGRIPRVWEVLGYLWVLMWFAWSLPGWLDPQLSVGLMEDGINVSVIEGLWRRNWTPKYPSRY